MTHRLLIVLGTLAACTGAAPGPTPAARVENTGDAANPLTIIPIGLTLVDEDQAPTIMLALRAAVDRRSELLRDEPPPGLAAGERAWFFRAFSARELVFLECRYAPVSDPRPIKRAGRYLVERRVVVPRSDRALGLLEVRDEIRQREDGICGVIVGMSAAALHAHLGPPTSTMYPAAGGCLVEGFGDLRVNVCLDAVTAVSVGAGGCPTARP